MEKHTLFMVLILVSIAVQSTVGKDEYVLTGEDRTQCLKVGKRTIKYMFKAFNTCNNKMKLHLISGEEYQKKIGCIVKCVMESIEVLDENGGMVEEKIRSWVVKFGTPEKHVDYALGKVMSCVKERKLDPKEEDCKSYLEVGTCVQGVVGDMCGGEAPLL